MPVEIEQNSQDYKICESCAKEFVCGVKKGNCWCFNLEIKPEVLANLREEFKSCLCQDCLNKVAEPMITD
jgi:hypothetical protein